MDWQTKRKVIYALVVLIFVTTVSIFLLRDILFPQPTCSDFKQNGYEIGVDCGGLCDKKCIQEVAPLTVLWSRAIAVSPTSYDLAGLVSNTNIDNASKELGYLFSVFGDNGEVVAQVSGSTTAPLDGKFPLIAQNVYLSKEPAKVSLALFDTDHFKVKENPTSPTVTISDRRYEATNTSRLYATVINNKRIELRNLEIRAVLYDSLDNAYAVGKTVVPFIDKEGEQEISFVWNSLLKEQPTRIGIYPIFNPFEAVTE